MEGERSPGDIHSEQGGGYKWGTVRASPHLNIDVDPEITKQTTVSNCGVKVLTSKTAWQPRDLNWGPPKPPHPFSPTPECED